jgi:RNA polymerase sigma-70 factor (ECF subfamily)
MERLQQYNETRGSMGAFVAIIARSTALNYCKSSIRRAGELIGDGKIDFLTAPIDVADDVEHRILIDNIIKGLNDSEAVLFTMRYIYFYTPEEIAKAFKITRNAVDARVNRIKKKVKKLLIKGGVNL